MIRRIKNRKKNVIIFKLLEILKFIYYFYNEICINIRSEIFKLK